MGLLKKPAVAKPIRMVGRSGEGVSALRPQAVEKLAPCVAECPGHNDIRLWINIIGQREKLGLTEEQALEKAWQILADKNPFPAVLGRVCPHPCETKCTRADKDGAVSINALERYLGDWAIGRKMTLPRIEADDKPESVGVIGAGPAGLSFAYQLARRGYKATVYERTGKAGGMLYWGIPFYRLPAEALQAEVQRIADAGVEIKLNTAVGRDVSLDDLKKRHKAIFIGIGAEKGKLMMVPGEDGLGLWTGTDYLHRVNGGEKVDLGRKVAVIGGGDTAIDAARAARRAGAEVTILYRRTRTEMPAIYSEIEDALKENVKLDLLVAPVEVKRTDGKVTGIVLRKMELGEPDSSGRRRPVPVMGSDYELPVDSIIAAISQEPNWADLDALRPKTAWVETDHLMTVSEGVFAGGDVANLGLATIAVSQGRVAAEVAHAWLRGRELPADTPAPKVAKERIKMDFYEAKPRAERTHRPVEEWLAKPDEEIVHGFTQDQFFQEIGRCFSCGLCFGCERCWMYCTPACFSKTAERKPGEYYKVKLETCDGCKKCVDECPCGYLDMV